MVEFITLNFLENVIKTIQYSLKVIVYYRYLRVIIIFSFGNDESRRLITFSMTSKTILFETVAAAYRAYQTLQKMIDVTKNCNAITYNIREEEAVRWLVKDNYCRVGAKKRVYIYPVSVIKKSANATLYQYNKLQIEHKSLPPAD